MLYKEVRDDITWCLNWKETEDKIYYKAYRLNSKGQKI